jgi:hypothetical protein
MNNETQSNKFIVNNPEIQLKAESIANEAEVNYSEMYGDQSNKFIAKEHKDNELDNLYHALYRLSNATNAVVSFIKTNTICDVCNQFKSHRTRKINWPQ